MENTSEIVPIPDREVFYHRARQQNRIFDQLIAFFAEEAEQTGATKRKIALLLKRDPASVTRWLSQPSNLTLDTISDLLLALEAEMDFSICKFERRRPQNDVHDWMAPYWNQGRARETITVHQVDVEEKLPSTTTDNRLVIGVVR